jgi:hypothetical protein
VNFFESSEDTGFDDLVDTDIGLVHTASYDEEALQAKIEATGMKKELFACAVQMSIIGWGRGNFGEVTIEGERKELGDVFNDAGVYYDNDPGTKLDPDDLTPKRIIRLFRYQIHKWIKKTGAQSFLMRKYGSGKRDSLRPYLFPGSEHFVVERDHAKALIDCYAQLDALQGTHFTERIKTVFKSRNVVFE